MPSARGGRVRGGGVEGCGLVALAVAGGAMVGSCEGHPGVSDRVKRISHYRLEGRLGKGGMGVVFRAVDELLGREVALKLLPKKLEGSPDMQARLLREAQAASQLNHPGIVTVHEFGVHEGRLFIVMELVDGERVSEVVRRGVPVAEALGLVLQAAEALATAHARKILH